MTKYQQAVIDAAVEWERSVRDYGFLQECPLGGVGGLQQAGNRHREELLLAVQRMNNAPLEPDTASVDVPGQTLMFTDDHTDDDNKL